MLKPPAKIVVIVRRLDEPVRSSKGPRRRRVTCRKSQDEWTHWRVLKSNSIEIERGSGEFNLMDILDRRRPSFTCCEQLDRAIRRGAELGRGKIEWAGQNAGRKKDIVGHEQGLNEAETRGSAGMEQAKTEYTEQGHSCGRSGRVRTPLSGTNQCMVQAHLELLAWL
jgi:hypothetical protein